jgi:hypothetical protein
MPVDLSSPAHYGLVLLPEIVLSVWAMFILLLDVFQKGSRSEPSSSSMPWLTLAGVVLAGAANLWIGMVGFAAGGPRWMWLTHSWASKSTAAPTVGPWWISGFAS